MTRIHVISSIAWLASATLACDRGNTEPREPGHSDSVDADALGDPPRAPGDAANGDDTALGDPPRMPGTDKGDAKSGAAPRAPGNERD
jgi:hypothetical protein